MEVLHITCLCAEWCGTCRSYRQVFAELAERLPEHQYHWIDIEDDAELVGDIDTETFPTLLISHQDKPLFAGVVLPRLQDIHRLVLSVNDTLAQGDTLPLTGLSHDQLVAFTLLAQRLSTA